MANKLACSCIQMTYAQLSLTIMGIIAYVSVWLSVGVFICWVWFGEGKGDILMLMCYILHNSAYPFQQNKRGGVIIYVRQDLHDVCETTIFNSPSGIEAAQLDINSTLTIVVVYRSPAVPIPQLNNVLNKIYHSQHCQHRVICGDFNIDIKDNPNAAHPSLPSTDQIIEEPTYFAGGTYTSLLGHIYIQNCTIFMSDILDTIPRCNICRYCIAWLSTMSSSTHKVRPQRWPLCNF